MSKKPKFVTLTVAVPTIDIEEAFIGVPNDVVMSTILMMDLNIADVGFTEDLITALLKSLKRDLKKDFDINKYAPK